MAAYRFYYNLFAIHLYWVAFVDLEHRLITQKYDSIITKSYANVTQVIENSKKE